LAQQAACPLAACKMQHVTSIKRVSSPEGALCVAGVAAAAVLQKYRR
jgi:hypothetical protein